ncbi:uncharacterized protein [Cicer arietinum]|uniref:uncharacterized protein n=1 Tax=Cicer arietinum TaxID=3827 RepID=UPI003CC62B57
MQEIAVISSMYGNYYPLISALIAFAIAQSIKLITVWYNEKRWDLMQLVGSGGMPSSHSATVTHPLVKTPPRPLRELLGHTPPQVVAGGLLGIVTATISLCIYKY